MSSNGFKIDDKTINSEIIQNENDQSAFQEKKNDK